MIGWIRKAVHDRAARVYLGDLNAFLAIVVNTPEKDLAHLMAHATHLRHAIENAPDRFGFPAKASLLEPKDFLRGNPRSYIRMGKIVRMAGRERNPLTVNGLLIWLHTLRAVDFPELRPKVRALWAELARGFPYVPQAAEAAEIAAEWCAKYDRFPEGCEPEEAGADGDWGNAE